MESTFQMAAIIVAVVGAGYDIKTGKIPNRWNCFWMLAGFAARLISGAWIESPQFLQGMWNGLTVGLMGFLTASSTLLLWFFGALKAGDIKLYMAIGILAGWRFCLNTIILSILAGGIIGLCVMLIRKNGRAALKRLLHYGVMLLMTRSFCRYEPGDDGTFCFGIAIAVGTVLAGVAPVV